MSSELSSCSILFFSLQKIANAPPPHQDQEFRERNLHSLACLKAARMWAGFLKTDSRVGADHSPNFPPRKQEPFAGLGGKGENIRSLTQHGMYGCESVEKGLFLSAQGFGGVHADLGDIYDAGAHAHNLLGITNLLDDDETTTHQPISRCVSALNLCHLNDVAFRTWHACRRTG